MTNTNVKKEKMTKVKALNYVLENFELPTEVKEKLESMVVTVSRKRVNEEKQNENERLAEIAVAYLETVEKATISEMNKQIPEFVELSNQKVSFILRTLVGAKKVVRIEEKKSVYFAINTIEGSEEE